MKKLNFSRVIIALALMLTGTLPSFAHDFYVNGIYYNITSDTDKTVEVTDSYTIEYPGSVVIPSSVTYNGTTYSVTSIGDMAFSGCTGLTSVTIPNSVTTIGDHAFYVCTGLKEVTIGNSVTSIGAYAFYDCPSLTEVNIYDLSAWCKIDFGGYCANPLDYARGHLKLNGTEITNLVIPDDITEIKACAFSGCTGLISVTIPNSVTSIGASAFSYCTGLTSVTIPNSVTDIGHSAFKGCRNLAELIIEDGKETLSLGSSSINSGNGVGIGLFSYCLLKKLYLGRNLDYDTSKSYGYSPFYNISTLKEITIGNSVTTIGDYAFYCCTGLKEVTIGNSVTSIGNYAFDGCTGLKEVTIPNSVTTIGNGAFRGCTNLKFVINLSNLTFSKGSNDYGYIAYYAYQVINVPNDGYIDGDFIWAEKDNVNTLVTYLGNATELILPMDFNGENYKIGNYAFYECDGLKNVTIGNSVTDIGNGAFSFCTDLATVYFNAENCTSMGSDAFYNCTNLKTINIGNSVKTIPSYAFSGCRGLTSVTIPNSVTSIGNSAFYGCTGLTKVNYNAESCTSMGYNVFDGCTNLKTINIGNSVKTIPSYTFSSCTYLTEVNISDLSTWCKIDFANEYANPLYYAGHLKLNGTEITYLVIPDDITEIKSYAFSGCTGLRSVTIPNSVTVIGYGAFSGCRGLTSVTIPNSVTSIGNSAFYGCTGLTSITIPNSVTFIGYSAFSGSGLRLIFSYCMTPPTCEDEAFYGCYDARLMVPEGTYYDYLVANEWYKFDKIQEIAGIEGVEVDNNAVEVARYDIYGRQLTEPTKGINIIKMSDGSTRKEYVK